MLKVNRETLSRALSMAQLCLETKGTIPALGFALFEPKDGSVQITATDLDVSLLTSIDAEGESKSFCIPARQLAQITALLKDESVAFEVKEGTGRVQVSCGRAKHLLPSMERESYPNIDGVKGKQLVVKASMLATMLERTAFAVTTDESRFAMQGVYLETKDGKLIAVATDGFRLAQVKYAVPFSDAVNAIVPLKAVRAILKTFQNDDPAMVCFGDDKIQVSQDRSMIIARTVTGTFPRYETIVPKERNHKITLDQEVVIAMKRSALTARDGIANNSPEVFFDVSRSTLAISSKHADKGESEEKLETTCATLNGEAVRLGIASKNILEIMAHEPEVEFGFNDNDVPFRITPTGLRDYEYVYVSMPVRLDV